VIGCSAADETATPAAAASVALFEDPSTSGPRLDIYDSGGEATIAVSGPIGTEAALSGFNGQESLTDIYRALHPEVATVPSELVALDEQIRPKLAALRARPRAATEAAPALIEKSESAFNSAVCKNFTEGSARYTVKYCNWGLACGVTTNWAKPEILPGDRTYAWNHNDKSSTLRWLLPNTYTPVASAVIPPYWWTWMTYTGGGGPFWATLDGGAACQQERGITWHSLSFIVK